jgi:hypothetical protein
VLSENGSPDTTRDPNNRPRDGPLVMYDADRKVVSPMAWPQPGYCLQVRVTLGLARDPDTPRAASTRRLVRALQLRGSAKGAGYRSRRVFENGRWHEDAVGAPRPPYDSTMAASPIEGTAIRSAQRGSVLTREGNLGPTVRPNPCPRHSEANNHPHQLPGAGE